MEEVPPFVDGALKEQVWGSVHVGTRDASGYTQIETFFVQKILILRTVLSKRIESTNRELKVMKIHKKMVCLCDCMVNQLFASQGFRNLLRLKHSSYQT